MHAKQLAAKHSAAELDVTCGVQTVPAWDRGSGRWCNHGSAFNAAVCVLRVSVSHQVADQLGSELAFAVYVDPREEL